MVSLEKTLSTQQHEKWIKKRKYTFIAFSIQVVIFGMGHSLLVLTLWLYIKEIINTRTPKLYYGVISVSYVLASFIMTPVLGRFFDKKRNVKFCFLICNLAMIIGNVLYSLPFSPLFLIVGRLVAGFGGSLESVIFSETIRSYPESETSTKLSILSIMLNFGLMLGPGVNFIFKDISFNIGRWHLQNVNFTGLFMGFVCIVMEIVTITMVHDVSKEFDYKASVEKKAINKIIGKIKVNTCFKNDSNDDIEENLPIVQYKNKNDYSIALYTKSNNHTIVKTYQKLFINIDSALLLITNFFLGFFIISTDIWLPLLVIDKMHLSMMELNICFFGASGISAFILLLFMWKPFSDKRMVVLLIISLGCFSTVSASFIILSYAPYNKVLNVVLCIVYILSFGGIAIIVDVFFIAILSKMVKSDVLTFADSIRSSMYTAGAFLGYITSPFMFDFVEIFGTVYVAVMIIIGIFFIFRKKNFVYPKIIV